MEGLKVSDYSLKNYSPSYASFFIFISAVMGLQPSFLSLQTFLVLLALVFVKVPLIPFIVYTGIFYIFGGAFIDQISHAAGKALLSTEFLTGLFGFLSEIPIIPLTRFNNTVFAGSFIMACFFAVCGFMLCKFVLLKNKTQ